MATKWTLFLTTLAICLAQPAMTQERRDVFANPQNLKALPKDISSQELGATMKGISMGTGLRCEGCHDGEAGQPLTTFDFESDEKPMKRKARLMLKMVDQINGKYVPRLDRVEKASRVEVRCVTCHRGQSKPKMIQDIMTEKLASEGLQGALAEYEALREKYHGGFNYDFSEFVLPMFAQDLLAAGNTDAAIAFAKTNVSYFPASTISIYTLGESYESAGNAELAIANFEKVMEIAPQFAPQVQPKIDALKK